MTFLSFPHALYEALAEVSTRRLDDISYGSSTLTLIYTHPTIMLFHYYAVMSGFILRWHDLGISSLHYSSQYIDIISEVVNKCEIDDDDSMSHFELSGICIYFIDRDIDAEVRRELGTHILAHLFISSVDYRM